MRETGQFKKCRTCNRRVLRSTGNDQCITCRGRKRERRSTYNKEADDKKRDRERKRSAAAGVPDGWAV